MKYRVELRENDQCGDLISSPAANTRHPTLYRAWAAAMADARSCSTALGMLVCIRVFDQFEQLAVTGRAVPANCHYQFNAAE
ncbi:MAG: hypothetical protein ACREO4_07910 [Lysobacter sp.]